MNDNTKPAKVFVDGLWIKEKKFDNGGSILKLNVVADKLIEFLKKHKNEKGYVNIVVQAKREPDEKSTHTASLDQWQPQTQAGRAPVKSNPPVKSSTPTQKPAATVEDDDHQF